MRGGDGGDGGDEKGRQWLDNGGSGLIIFDPISTRHKMQGVGRLTTGCRHQAGI
jgi:hypothetical protein